MTGNPRLTMEDVFYNNNRNAFVSSEKTLSTSKKAGALILECVWSEPSIDEGVLSWCQKRELVEFSKLTIEQDSQRSFWFDADAARIRCETELNGWPLRNDFHKYWIERGSGHDDNQWFALRRRFVEHGIYFPGYPDEEYGLTAFLDTMYSAREGRPVGWGYENLVQVAHHVFDRYKGHLWAFRLMLAAHERGRQIKEEDATGNWRNRKVKKYLKAWADNDPEFTPDRRFDGLMSFLFPEIAAKLSETPK